MAVNVITGAAYLKRIKAPASGRLDYRDKGTPGLYLRVTSRGAMIWRLIAWFNGRQIAFELGHYAESESGLGLADARRKAEEWKRRIKAGDDPRPGHKADKARKLDTFSEIRGRFFTQHVDRNLKRNTQIAYRSALEGARFKAWEFRSIKSITRGDVVKLIDDIAEAGNEVLANRTLAYLRKFFNWCAEKDIIKPGEPIPTDRVKAPLKKEVARDRYLSPDEIRLLWQATGEMGYPYGPVYRLFIVTGQRKTECASMRWADIGGSQWVQADNKADREHIVPLNEMALSILAECPELGEYVFTTLGDRPINGFSKSKVRLDKRLQELAAEQGAEGAFVERWQIHDLRRTITTHLRKAGVSRDMCSLLLNHAEKGVTAAHYDHYDQLPEKTAAMEAWRRLLDEFINGRPDSVVCLTSATRAQN